MLWICFYGFGDVLEWAADAYNVKRRFPGAHVALLTSPKYAEPLRAQPYLDEVLIGGKSLYAEWWNTLRKIRVGRYKWVIPYHGGEHSAWLTRFSGTSRHIDACNVGRYKRSFRSGYFYHCGAPGRGARLIVSASRTPAFCRHWWGMGRKKAAA
ncbi:MAG: hypothetical protein LBD04_08390 [Synergistaceae bacterium]|nr:hypothetical protein [Synergistaceae bacterium]